MKTQATHEISACYFPKKGEVDLTFQELESGERMELTIKVTPEQGNWFAEHVMACVYHAARVTNEIP